MIEHGSRRQEVYSRAAGIGHLPLLDMQAIDKGNAFLERIDAITPVPELHFSRSASVFAFVPMLRESETVERVHESWRKQEVPAGTRAEVIFLVNNPQDASREVTDDNRKTYNFLNNTINNSRENPSIGLHVVDKFSEGNALPSGTRIADVRNIAVSPIVRHVLETRRTGVVLSTDADCFPSKNVAAELNKAFRRYGSMYGVIERELAYPADMPSEEKKQIERLILIHTSEEILLEQLSYGDWQQPNMFAGSNSFFTIDNFLKVDGYTSGPDIIEDTDLRDKLSSVNPKGAVILADCYITNLQRYSDRVDGDGVIYQKVKSRGNKTSLHAETTIAHAKLRRWFIGALANAKGDKEKEAYEQIYENALKKAYANDYDVPEALKSYDALIMHVLGKDKKFMGYVEKLQKKGVDREELFHLALQLQVAQY